MHALSPLLVLAGLYALVLASPGPNFFMLGQLALQGRRREARHVVFGLVTASVAWAALVLAGVATVLARHPWLARGVQWLGAAYLVWYGGRLLLAALRPAPVQAGDATRFDSSLAAYRTGLVTGLTNPKGAAFWLGALSTAGFPPDAPRWLYLSALLVVLAMSLAGHLGIALLFSTRPLRATYLRASRPINAVAGGALVALGLHRIAAR